MTPLWMLHLAATALLLALAARLAEAGLRLVDRPARWAWLGSIVGTPVLSLLARALPTSGPLDLLARWLGVGAAAPTPGPGTAGGGEGVVLLLTETAWGPGAAVPAAADRAALALWGLSSAAALLFVAFGYLRLHRRARAWPERRVGGSLVRVSPDTGPAVLGLLRPLVVLPEWVVEMEPERQRLVLRHEREHLEGGDPWLVAVALAVLVAMPWNLPLWWAFRRLRLATEIDCDRRVLERATPTLAYGRLLLEVGVARSGTGLPVAALAEPSTDLEARIRAMTRPSPKHPVPKAAGLALATALLVAAACDAPGPADPGASGASSVAADLDGMESAGGAGDASLSAGEGDPPVVDRDTEPRLANADRVRKALRDAYPETLKDAGVGGRGVRVGGAGLRAGEDGRTRVRIRGGHAARIEERPVVFVDGRRIGLFARGDDGQVRIGDREIDPDEIESIQVVKGPAAVKTYGEDGRNGVILITTKADAGGG